jgi:hypothetical protein
MITCSPHPDAPHGFNRNASHSSDRYVCNCEGWVPDEYKLGYNQALEDALEVVLDNISLNGGTAKLEAHCRQDIQDLHKR